MGGEYPLTIHEISLALTPTDFRSDWTSESAAAKIIKSKVKVCVHVHPMSVREGGCLIIIKILEQI